jgi:ribonuclease P protein component
MPPRDRRFRRARDVGRVLRWGRRLPGRRLVVYVLPGEGTRAAFVCGRRVGSSVHRNRARRIMREAWAAVSRDVLGAHDVVFVARPEIRGCRTGDVVSDMRGLLASAGVIRE